MEIKMNSKKYVWCPHCEWVISYLVFIYVRYDYPCPNCGKKVLSEFEDSTLYDDQNEKND